MNEIVTPRAFATDPSTLQHGGVGKGANEKTSAYVVVVNRGRLSERVRRSLAAARSSGYFTAIVENGRGPLAGSSPADLVFRMENRGYGPAVNAGIREVRKMNPQLSNVVFSNDDIEIPREAFEELERRVTDRPDGIYSLASTHPDGTSYFGVGEIDLAIPHLVHKAPPVAKGVTPSGAINGAVVACAPQLWDRVGGFDERFFLYFEDLDLTMRLAQRKVPMVVLSGYRVIHEGGKSSAGARPAQRYYYIRSQILFARKWLRRDQALLLVMRALVRGAIGGFVTWRGDLRRLRRARFLAAWDALTHDERGGFNETGR